MNLKQDTISSFQAEFRRDYPFRLKLYKLICFFFLISLILLVYLDFIEYFGYEESYKPYVRGVFLMLFIFSLFGIPTIRRKHSHFLAVPLVLFGYLLFSYALIGTDPLSELYYVSRILYWVVGTFFFYRMLLIDAVNIELFKFTLYLIACMYFVTIFYVFFDHDAKFSQNIKVYTLIWMLPTFFLFEKSKWRNVAIALVCVCIFLSFKRGAILALLISFFMYYFTKTLLMKNFKIFIKSISFYIVIFLCLISVLFLIKQNRPEYFERRTSDISDMEKFGSNRVSFYPIILDHYFSSLNHNPINFFLGYGSRSVQNYTEHFYGVRVYAHSDWIQLVHDYGLFGFFIFIFVHIKMIMTIIKNFIAKNESTPVLVMIYTSFFLTNIYSGMTFHAASLYFGMSTSLFFYMSDNNIKRI